MINVSEADLCEAILLQRNAALNEAAKAQAAIKTLLAENAKQAAEIERLSKKKPLRGEKG